MILGGAKAPPPPPQSPPWMHPYVKWRVRCVGLLSMQFSKTKNCNRISSLRIESLPWQEKVLLNRVTAGDLERHTFEEFSTEIVGILKDIWICLDAKHTPSSKWEKLWSFFPPGMLIPVIWYLGKFFVCSEDRSEWWSVNQKIIEMILLTQLSTYIITDYTKKYYILLYNYYKLFAN